MNQMLKRPFVVKKTEIGELIREFRLLTGLTQEQFGALCDLYRGNHVLFTSIVKGKDCGSSLYR